MRSKKVLLCKYRNQIKMDAAVVESLETLGYRSNPRLTSQRLETVFVSCMVSSKWILFFFLFCFLFLIEERQISEMRGIDSAILCCAKDTLVFLFQDMMISLPILTCYSLYCNQLINFTIL